MYPILLLAINDPPARLHVLEGMPHYGWKVLTAGHADEVPALVFQHQPELLLFDLNNAQAINPIVQTLRIPRILLSPAPDRAQRLVLHKDYRACALISPPIDVELLAAQADALRFSLQPPVASQNDAAKAHTPEIREDDIQTPWVLARIRWQLTAPNGSQLNLTGAECKFLAALAEQPGKPVSRRSMIGVLGHSVENYDMRRLDMLVSRLRQKIQRESGCSLPVRSIHAVGYSFVAPIQVLD